MGLIINRVSTGGNAVASARRITVRLSRGSSNTFTLGQGSLMGGGRFKKFVGHVFKCAVLDIK